MATVFSDVLRKQVAIESVLAFECELDELRAIATALREIPVEEEHTQVSLTRHVRDVLDAEKDEVKKGQMLLSMVAIVPHRLSSKLADIMIKGPTLPNAESALGASANAPEAPLLERQQTQQTPDRAENSIVSENGSSFADIKSSLRREFRIEGKIGDEKGSMNSISLEGQIEDAISKGYSQEEIASAVKKAVSSSELKTYLYSQPNMTLDQIRAFLKSVCKEKSSSDLFQILSNLEQSNNEDPQTFLVRAMEIRQKCLLASKKPGQVQYKDEVLRPVFLKTVRLGLMDNFIKARLETVINQNPEIDDGTLIQELNVISTEENDRRARKKHSFPRVNEVSIGDVVQGNDSRHVKQTEALHDTVRSLTEQMTALTDAVARLQMNQSPSKANDNKNGQQRRSQQSQQANTRRNWRACENCTKAKKQASCRHCWECGQDGHKALDCPTSN